MAFYAGNTQKYALAANNNKITTVKLKRRKTTSGTTIKVTALMSGGKILRKALKHELYTSTRARACVCVRALLKVSNILVLHSAAERNYMCVFVCK